MRSISKAIVSCLMFMSLVGCQSNEIGTHFASHQTQNAVAQRVGIARFRIIFYTDKYLPRGSIAGMLQSGIEDLVGDDSREKLEAQQETRREQILTPILQTLSNTSLIQYIPAADDNPSLALPFGKNTLENYAQAHDLDLVLDIVVALQRHPSGLFNKEGNSHLGLRQSWHFYTGNGKRLGMISVEGLSDHFDLPMGSYDTREEQFAQRFIELAKQTSRDCLVQLKHEIRDAQSQSSPTAFKDN